MKQHPNSGATIWATLAAGFTPNTVISVSTYPAGRRIFAVATGETCDPGEATRALGALDVALSAIGTPFRGSHVERWFVREMPGRGALIGNRPWDRHPAYVGPMDSFIYVYDPTASDQRAAAEAAAPPEPEPPAPVVAAPVVAVETPAAPTPPAPASAPARSRTKRIAAPTGSASVTKTKPRKKS